MYPIWCLGLVLARTSQMAATCLARKPRSLFRMVTPEGDTTNSNVGRSRASELQDKRQENEMQRTLGRQDAHLNMWAGYSLSSAF